MPNDMSKRPRLPDTITLLGERADRYMARARVLMDSPGLTTAQAANALHHLAELQADLARARRVLCHDARLALEEIEGGVTPLEAALTATREALTHALLGAAPSEDAGFGRVPHGALPEGMGRMSGGDAYPGTQGGTEETAERRPRPDVRAVSACRALLDLEALRPYLGDEALRLAIEKHAHDTGRCDVRGVSYAALPTSAHLPYPVQ